jgi:hypothetical protein
MQERANAEGWRLVTTVESGDTHPLWDITRLDGRFATDKDAAMSVIDAAKRGSAFHQQTLKLVLDSRVRPNRSKKK